MRELIRSSITTGMAIAAAGALAVAPAVLPTEPHSPPVITDVRLSAATATTPAIPPPGALIEQFVVNQIEDCALICPFIVQLATQVPVNFAIIPFTFVSELQAGTPLLQAIALTDATVSGAANTALTGIIDNDLSGALPRAQNSLEVALIQLIDIATTAVTQPANLLSEIITARTNFFDALAAPPGQPLPAAHNAVEAAVLRTVEIASSLTFQAPERLLLGVTQAADAFFRTLGNTGNLGTALQAVGTSLSTTLSDSVAFIQHAFTEPIPITSAATPTGATSTTPATAATTTTKTAATTATTKTAATTTTKTAATTTTTKTTATDTPNTAVTNNPIHGTTALTQTVDVRPLLITPQLQSSSKTGNRALATQPLSTTAPTLGNPDQVLSRGLTSLGTNNRHTAKKPGH